MGSMTHAAGRAAFSTALDVTLKNLNKKPEGEIVKLIDLMQKYMDGEKIDIDYDKAPAQLKYVQDIMAKATGTFGFYNESLASVEAGDCFDNAMVDIFLGNQTPEEAFHTVQTFYEENVWE